MAENASLDDFKDPAARQMAQAVVRGDVGHALALSRNVRGGVNAQGADGDTPLFLATVRNDPAMVEALLKAGAHPNGGPGRAPIQEAVKGRDQIVARILLNAGADPNGRSGAEPALFEAALLGEPARAELLLKAGARVDEKDSLGGTAALIAASANNWALVLVFLHHGATPWATNTGGVTIGDFAFSSRLSTAAPEGTAKAEVEELLRRAGVPWPPPAPPQVRALVAAGHWPPVHR